MKTDITKGFRCQQAISMGELCKTNDGLLPLVLSDFEVNADTVQEITDDDVLIQILKLYYRLHPQRVQINILVGLSCGM